MIPALEAYYRPDRLEDALQLLAREAGVQVLGGGTDLLLGDEPLGAVVDISRLGLDALREADGDLRIGSTVRVEDLLQSEAARTWADGILVGACLNFGTLQVRNMATVGGNIAHALPAADLVPALIALDAELHLARADGEGHVHRRTLPLDGFATAPFTSQLEPGELIVDVRVPATSRSRRAQFRKIGRVQKDLSQVNCAVALQIESGSVREARIVVGAVHPVVTRVLDAERELIAAIPGRGDWSQRSSRAVDAVRAFVRPITDVRATREWRRHVVGSLVRRSLEYVAEPANLGRVPCYDDGPLYRVGVADGGAG